MMVGSNALIPEKYSKLSEEIDIDSLYISIYPGKIQLQEICIVPRQLQPDVEMICPAPSSFATRACNDDTSFHLLFYFIRPVVHANNAVLTISASF
jgi:hypothetical protein